jgi:hypothetical protein
VSIVDEVRQGNVNGLKFIYDLCQVLKEYDVTYINIQFGKCTIHEKLNEYLLFEPLEEILSTSGNANQKNVLQVKKKNKYRQDLVDRAP